MFLDEHVWAPLIMSVAFIVALLGVLALGAYVVYCDAKNRAGEEDLALADNHSPASAHRVDEREADREAVEPAEAATASPPVTARSVSRRRKPGAPPPA